MQNPSEDFLRFHCRKIFLRNLTLDCQIGAYETEKGRSQQVRFECEVWLPLSKSSSSGDDLNDVLNYDHIVSAIRSVALSGHINLQETLVHMIADRLVAFPDVVLLRLSSAKTEAYEDVDAVGVEVWRRGSACPAA